AWGLLAMLVEPRVGAGGLPKDTTFTYRNTSKRNQSRRGQIGGDDWKVDDDPHTSGGDGPLQTLFFGGPILTIGDDLPEVEALAIRDGRIIALGDRQEVFQF